MGRKQREIYSGQVYEICLRTRQGLPFTCRKYMKMLLLSVMARVQRDQKVTLCHYLWMANHIHMVVISKDREECTKFYGEIQKQLTDAVKRLLGLRHLTLWINNSASVIPLYDVETACYRIAYIYANPAAANLVEKISDYPGLSSWREFRAGGETPSALDATFITDCPWVRAPYIEPLLHLHIDRQQDLQLCNEWEESAQDSHELVVEPNAWMECFHIESEEEIQETNRQIVKFHTGLEGEAQRKRREKKRKVMGKKQLIAQPLNMQYVPPKKSRRIAVYSLDPALRKYLIQKYDEFCSKCRECYERWKIGDLAVKWPIGAFLPRIPTLRNDFPLDIGATAYS